MRKGDGAARELQEGALLPVRLFLGYRPSGAQARENSKEYNDALIASDGLTGKIVQKLNDLAIHDRTLLYVTSDHGFDEGKKRHRNAPFVFLATNDRKVKGPGHREDITPTILNGLGVNLNKIEPPLSGHPLNR